MMDNEDDIPKRGEDFPRSSIIGGRIVGVVVLIGLCALLAWACMRPGS